MSRLRRVPRTTGRVALVSAVAIAVILAPAAPAAADAVVVEGALGYEPLSTSVVDESVTANTVSLRFDTAGGPFTATVSLMIGHDFRDRECRFDSSHEWTVAGEFDPGTGQFTGDYVEVTEQTIGACENTEFTRTFDPDQGRFVARLDRASGIITSQIPPLGFELAVDPEILDLVAPPDPVDSSPPEPTSSLPPTGTTGGDRPLTEPTTGASPGPEPTAGGDGGFPWPVVVVVFVAGSVPVIHLWRRARTPSGRSGGCEELMVAWQAAQRDCDRRRSESDELSRQFDEAAARRDRARRDLDGLPSEETRVELPDGTALSQLDLEFRREAAGAAWDAYMADPSPETARAAEDAWNEQATPEWLEERRRAHREQVDDLQRTAAAAAAETDDLGRRLAAARTVEQNACARATDLKQQLDECLGRAAAAAATPAPPPSAPPAGPPTTPTPAEEPAPAGRTGSDPEPPDDDRRCTEGDERWVTYDGPHPFQVPGRDERVDLGVALIVGTRRFDRLASLDASTFPHLDDRGRAHAIAVDTLALLTDGEVRDAFSGQRGLAAMWETVGAGAVQQVTITLTLRVRHVLASCERLERCVGGRWVVQDARRTGLEEREEQEQVRATVRGNIEAGRGRTEEDYVAEIVALFGRARARAKGLMSAAEQLADYTTACSQGRR